MKKTCVLALLSLSIVLLSVSCDDSLGKTGPGGGIIFYVADSVQTSVRIGEDGQEETYSWRCLEAAPEDLDGEYSYADAATECGSYRTVSKGKTYDDWFLPDKYELNYMYNNLANKGIGGFRDMEYYWSSSRSDKTPDTAEAIRFKIGYAAASLSNLGLSEKCRVRPVRAYL